ncbi:MAG TPA: immunoglobulin domain-containing protein [Verrucomicrobiae bacterium]|nr:immunoglobulin domain-containing protein [Verrucomicrobiae bacterium]
MIVANAFPVWLASARRRRLRPLGQVLIAAVLALVLVPARSVSAAEETLEINHVGFSAGGGLSEDSFFSLAGTFGSPFAEVASDDVFALEAGFWPASLKAPPAILQQPQNTIVSLGAPVLFEIGTAGDPPLKYQWRLNGVDIPGATNGSFFVSSAQLTNGGSYTVLVFNGKGSTLSEPFNLGFTLVRTPPENIFVNRASIVSTNVLFSGDNTNATRESGEMRHAGKPGGHSVWYKWTAPETGIATFATTGSAFDTLLAVYTGNDVSQLTPVAANDDVRGRFLASEVRFNAVKDVEYQIAVDGLGGAEGEFVISWNLETTSDVLPVFSQTLAGRTVPDGGSTIFSANAVGASLTYQWYFNQARIAGATQSTISISDISVDDIGLYFVAVTNGLGRGVHSDEAALEIGSAGSALSYSKFAEAVGEANAVVNGSGGGGLLLFRPAAVQAPMGFQTVSVGPIIGQGINNSNAIANSCAACGESVGGAMQTYILEPQLDGLLTIDTIGSVFDTILYVYSNAPLSQICSALVTCDDNGAPDGLRSRVSFPARAKVRYLVGIDGVNGAQGSIMLHWQLCLTAAPFEISDAGFTLRTPANPGVYPDLPQYHWLQNNQEVASTTEPYLALGQSPAAAVNFSVRYAAVTNGAILQVTNKLGVFVSATTSLTSTSPPFQRIVLPGLTSPGFRVEAAMTTMTNCDGRWLWIPVTDYLVTTQQSSLVITLPADSTNRVHRIRPTP